MERATRTKRTKNMMILLIAVGVLCRSQRVSDTLNGVDDWTGEVICWIDSAEGAK